MGPPARRRSWPIASAVLAATAAGRGQDMLVADCLGHGVLRYGHDGGFLGEFVKAGSAGLDVPHSMIWGRDGNGDGHPDLYVAAAESGAVHRYDGRTGAPVGDGIFAIASLDDARDLEWGPDRSGDGEQDLYVLNGSGFNRILWYDGVSGALGGVIVTFASGGMYSNGEFMAFGPDFNADGIAEFYCTSLTTDLVYRFNGQTGAFMGHFVNGEGELISGRELVFRDDGHLYVCDGGGDRVARYHGATGQGAEVFVEAGSGGLDLPHGLAFGPDGNGDGVEDLYVAGEFSASVTRYDGLTGELIDVPVPGGAGGLQAAASILFMPIEPPACPADLDGDGSVGVTDLLALLSAWDSKVAGPPDLDGDGVVGIGDLLPLLAGWGPCA